MKAILLSLAAVGLMATGSAHASQALAQKNNCLSCHAIDKQVVGPSYKAVAAKYKGDAAAPAKLAEKIKKGGSGVWGAVPMPPNPQVSDADMKALVQWILAQK